MGNVAKYGAVGGLIVFGTTTSLFAKIVYEIQSIGKDGQEHWFHKPWAMTTVMFLGMSCCLPLAYWQERKRKQQQAQEEDAEVPLLDGQGPKKPRNELKETLMLAIPTIFDLLATVLMNVGLLWVTASVYQMMRGAEMLFAALFAVTFLGRKLNKYHLLGIFCCISGVLCVGTSSYFSGSGSVAQEVTPEQNLSGMALIIISQAVQAAQLTFEDFFMADMDIAPMKIVGYEGLFGVIFTLGLMAPAAYYLPGTEGEGVHEDGLDTLAMIRNSRPLQIILAVDMVALLLYNVAGMMVTGQLGAVFRTVLETTRTLFVWLVGLLLYYTPLGMGKVGEPWGPWSWLQAFGFAVLVTGTLVYGRGNEEGHRQELREAMAVQAAQEPMAPSIMGDQDGHPAFGSVIAGASTAHVAPATAAYTIPGARSGAMTPSEPVDMLPSSFKASHTIASGSYSRSLGRGGPGAFMRSSRHQGGADD